MSEDCTELFDPWPPSGDQRVIRERIVRRFECRPSFMSNFQFQAPSPPRAMMGQIMTRGMDVKRVREELNRRAALGLKFCEAGRKCTAHHTR